MPEYWTSRAWSDSHADYFTRNIWTFDTGASSAEAAVYAELGDPNSIRPTWPTFDEVLRWAKSINDYPGLTGGPGPNVENLQLCLDASIERMAGRCHLHVRPVDAAGAVDVDGDPVEIPASVKLATIMQAVRWARRAMSPDGVLGASEISGVIRAQAMDPDIEAMIAPYVAVGLY